ncbi:UdgX family uracil-DNA binding protein [Albimonas sp. CAU 1670]|uniref:UdgX family uracil-DNA binding protein n=1 Tax=Albimonas sp. CAU 1670 TaxID=3032599 RepID=UPI0023DCAB25|nr:UdgX family uracil-DNA binding protein [Albimonas sp. CAU 1670]MDF2231558.1 UdgX family uracil-DNA binding protein [Albimonas sp. CAU 1670]
MTSAGPRHVALPRIGTAAAWRVQARALLAENVPPEAVTWSRGEAEADLFAGSPAAASPAAAPSTPASPMTVPRSFVALADWVVWHADPERFARLYALLHRLRTDKGLMSDRGDPAVARLEKMAKEVRRDRHKMTAFVRFREIGDPAAPRRRFAAWFEPSHYTLEPTAPFFAKRFGDMDWSIFTPDLAAHFEGGQLRLADPPPRPDLPQDAAEDLWRTYFRSIFNPARLKPKAMQAEMPKKYWRNLPEAALIPEMIAGAQARAREMAEAAPTLAPARAARIRERLALPEDPVPGPDRPATLPALAQALETCRRCPLWESATQPVPGEGPPDAPLMLVGEQPGDREDLTGRPFVGPAGQLFDRAAQAAGLDRSRAYITNAVKHFKFTPRGKRRLHQNPDRAEIHPCRWWLDLEREIVSPKLIVAMGGTALESLTGDRRALLKRRGGFEETADGAPLLVTVHPSWILRLPDAMQREDETARFADDLRRAVARVA